MTSEISHVVNNGNQTTTMAEETTTMAEETTTMEKESTMDDTAMDDAMRTPTMRRINVADAYDWKHLAVTSEKEVLIAQAGLERERRKNRRLESQLGQSAVGWADSNQHCQALLNSNYVLSQELQRLRFTNEALEAVIQKLFMAPRPREDDKRISSGYVTV
ncbi:hypothetical protein V494_07955 [Pseudogymnoascus sp. VKM F-4513 (FW-928)]|nr:hypothetical protein V494_07955 [Pseudogymnoascus sp. VKM F-4513 (FW-928)]